MITYMVNKSVKKAKTIISTIATYRLMRLWNIQISSGCKFHGIPRIENGLKSTVRIGHGCVFRSAIWSNSVGINHPCIINAEAGATIIVGNECGFSGTTLSSRGKITIGDRVMCGANSIIMDNDRHPLSPKDRYNNETVSSLPVKIEDDVWIGMNAIVLKGVTIGNCSVIAANSVVTKSIPANVLAAGVPAKPIRKFEA